MVLRHPTAAPRSTRWMACTISSAPYVERRARLRLRPRPRPPPPDRQGGWPVPCRQRRTWRGEPVFASDPSPGRRPPVDALYHLVGAYVERRARLRLLRGSPSRPAGGRGGRRRLEMRKLPPLSPLPPDPLLSLSNASNAGSVICCD
ncbi:uncharacterized protein LOC104583706 [Brachypodium distachyon]|uniref:uncharacterized protein LOC104583706 n=1 Tax=Brachypodium distachyon TaxID=15368 RepID=UPI00071D034D|nr:uncharacterized protein LOC104583706 [Brachypodium distachyon]|eukprot:XP_014755837.1 uncharacterized protein LOC104583706 [Brachypodium distachyon]